MACRWPSVKNTTSFCALLAPRRPGTSRRDSCSVQVGHRYLLVAAGKGIRVTVGHPNHGIGQTARAGSHPCGVQVGSQDEAVRIQIGRYVAVTAERHVGRARHRIAKKLPPQQLLAIDIDVLFAAQRSFSLRSRLM